MGLWSFWRRRRMSEMGARMRAEHSRWLTRALHKPEAYPRIPARLVSLGGFSAVTETPEGRDWAETWWDEAIDAADA